MKIVHRGIMQSPHPSCWSFDRWWGGCCREGWTLCWGRWWRGWCGRWGRTRRAIGLWGTRGCRWWPCRGRSPVCGWRSSRWGRGWPHQRYWWCPVWIGMMRLESALFDRQGQLERRKVVYASQGLAGLCHRLLPEPWVGQVFRAESEGCLRESRTGREWGLSTPIQNWQAAATDRCQSFEPVRSSGPTWYQSGIDNRILIERKLLLL